MVYNPASVVSEYFPLDDFMFTYNISGVVTQADLGKAVTQDTTAPNTMRLAADGEAIQGRLFSLELRTASGLQVGTVERKFKARVPKTAPAIALGNEVVGSATLGAVKATAAQPTEHLKSNRVIEVGADYVVVEKF